MGSAIRSGKSRRRVKRREIPRVTLRAMSEKEFVSFIRWLEKDYANDHVRDGQWTKKESLANSKRDIARLLPAGLATKGHYILSARSMPGDKEVGIAWLFLDRSKKAFIYYVQVRKQFRGRGYGEAIMQAMEQLAVRNGAGHMGLHVFGWNTAARNLYRKLGFIETNVVMGKELRARSR